MKKILSFLFPIPSIILIMLFAYINKNSTLDGIPTTTGQWLFLTFLAFIVIIIPLDTIIWYARKRKTVHKKKYYLGESYEHKEAREHAQMLLNRARELAQRINTTTDSSVFEGCLRSIKKVFAELEQYESYIHFTGLPPSEQLKKICQNEPLTRQNFEERVKALSSKPDLHQTIMPRAEYEAIMERKNAQSESCSEPRPTDDSWNMYEQYAQELMEEEKQESQKHTNFDALEGHDFEYFCADLLRKNGYENVEVTRGSGDHGIDIFAEKDDITYAIQCKCYSSNIGNKAVQEANAGRTFYNKDIAVVLTNRYFTRAAKEEAAVLKVRLWDREKLLSLIKE